MTTADTDYVPSMPIGSPEVRERLLDLFPADAVRDAAPGDGPMTKAEAAAAIAAAGDLPAIRNFVADNFGRLHQHVFLFERGGGVVDPGAAFAVGPFATRNHGGEHHYFYLLPLTYQLVLDDPLERKPLEFAWPVRLVVSQGHVRLHLTIMAKTPSAYVEAGRPVVRAVHSPTESELIQGFPASIGLAGSGPLDLNKGIKALWAENVFDAPAVQFKRERSTSKDVMDEAYTVKRDAPEIYGDLIDKPLFQTTLRFMGDAPCIDYFIVDPTNGAMVFRRYSASEECVDSVIRNILKSN